MSLLPPAKVEIKKLTKSGVLVACPAAIRAATVYLSIAPPSIFVTTEKPPKQKQLKGYGNNDGTPQALLAMAASPPCFCGSLYDLLEAASGKREWRVRTGPAGTSDGEWVFDGAKMLAFVATLFRS